MRLKAVVVSVFALALLSICGCPRPEGPGKVVLPLELAGAWQARESTWKIVLSPDGTVSSAVFPTGIVEIRPNKTTKVQMKDSQFSTYRAGDCPVEYTPATRELFVTVKMEEIHIRYLDNAIDGNSVDRFFGPVSQDGKVWNAEWINVFDYGPRFPQDANDIYAQPLIFDKVEN